MKTPSSNLNVFAQGALLNAQEFLYVCNSL